MAGVYRCACYESVFTGIAAYLKGVVTINSRKGFTLIEMVIVLAIIGILSVTAYPKIAGYMTVKKEQYRDNQEYLVNKALKQYYAFRGVYPDALLDGILDSTEVDPLFMDIKEKTSVVLLKGDYSYNYNAANKHITVNIP